MTRVLAWLLAACVLHCGPLASAAQQPQPHAAQSAAEEPVLTVTPDMLARVRAAIGKPRSILLETKFEEVAGRPVYRMRVQGDRFTLPDLESTLFLPFQRGAPGGLYHDEIMNLITPPQFRSSSMTGSETLQFAVTGLLFALATRGAESAVRNAREAWRTREQLKIREEIRRELAALEEENRKAAEEKEKETSAAIKKVP